MTIDTKCQCGSREYELVDASLGKVQCVYCKALRVEQSLIKKTETEKFIELQNQRPKVVYAEPRDEEIMRSIFSVFALGSLGGFRRIGRKIKRLLIGLAFLALLIVILIFMYKTGAFEWLKLW
jgi:hypothetical protein